MRRYTALLLMAVCFGVTAPSNAQVAVYGETVYTMDGDPIDNGVIVIEDGRISAVGREGRVRVPSGATVYRGAVVTPGLIDAHATVGLTGITNQAQDQDVQENSNAFQPELRAMDAYNGRDPLVGFLAGLGITTVNTGPAPTALSGGQTMIVSTGASTVQEGLIKAPAMVSVTLGNISGAYKSPGTRAKIVAAFREAMLEAQAYTAKRENGGAATLRGEILADMRSGAIPILITAHKAHDILTAIRLQAEFGFKMILDGAAEAYLVLDEIKASGVPVIIHPPMIRTNGAAENAAFSTAAQIHAAGIPFAFQSSYEAYVPKTRVVLFEAAIAAANGLDREATLEALTIGAANILGISDTHGKIAVGRAADLVVFDGDPLEYTTHACTVFAAGALVSDTCN